MDFLLVLLVVGAYPMAEEIKFEDNKNDVCIVSYARTPCGAFGGALSSFTAPQVHDLLQ